MSLLTMLQMLCCSLAPSGGHHCHHRLALVSLYFALFDWDRFEGWIRIECPLLAADWLTIFRVDLLVRNIPVVENEFDLGFCQFFEYVQGPHVDFYHIFGEILYHKSHIWTVALQNEQPRGFSNEKDNFEMLRINSWKVPIKIRLNLRISIEVGKIIFQSNFQLQRYFRFMEQNFQLRSVFSNSNGNFTIRIFLLSNNTSSNYTFWEYVSCWNTKKFFQHFLKVFSQCWHSCGPRFERDWSSLGESLIPLWINFLGFEMINYKLALPKRTFIIDDWKYNIIGIENSYLESVFSHRKWNSS